MTVVDSQSVMSSSPAEVLGSRSLTRREVELERRVKSFLEGRNIPGLRRVGIDVQGDNVVLHGQVRTFYEKQLAVHCCRRVAGVLNVIDSIDVHTN